MSVHSEIDNFSSYNEEWLAWNKKNEQCIAALLDAFPAIIETNDADQTLERESDLDYDDQDNFWDLIDTMILVLRRPEWRQIIYYMQTDEYDPEIETILSRIDDQLDNEELTDMELELGRQMYAQYIE